MPLALAHTNLNHSAGTQSLLIQCLAEWGGGLAIAADPYRIPESHPNWAGERFTLVEWRPIDVAGCYFPPRLTRGEYEDALKTLGEHIRRRSPRPVLVGGDFNAHALEWGSPSTDSRGDSTLLWAARHGLVLLNRGRASTFVGARGESIVDLTWATPAAAIRIKGWRVDASFLGEMSDHRLIRMELVSIPAEESLRRRRHEKERRWALRKLDPGALEVSLLSSTWPEPNPTRSVEEEANWLGDAMSRACDASMPRCRPVARKATYWWYEELAQLRRATVAARKRYTRHRRRGTDAEVEVAAGALREARSALRAAIRRAKADAWRELVSSLDRDPWGRPYKILTKQYRPWAPPIMETLDAQFLDDVEAALFPTREKDIPERVGRPSG
ncbi:PO11 protein, partial [Pseudoatta argentina]